MTVPAVLNIVPAMTFRPLSPVLAQLIENAYRDLAEAQLRPAQEAVEPVVPVSETSTENSASSAGLDRRT